MIKQFFKMLPIETAKIFTIIMTVHITISLVLGVEVISVNRNLQLLAISVLGGALMLTAFSDIFVKKISFIWRLVIFIVPFFIITMIFAIVFSWIDFDFYRWLIFIGIFLVCFSLSLIIYFVECKIKGKKYTEKLIEYQNNKE